MLHSKIEGTGRPLLIIHGFLGMLDNWKTLAGQYVANGFEVHAIDMRNHGKSLHSDIFDYNVMVNDIFEYCTGNALGHVNIIGHSMGGKASMFFASRYPERVDKLIIADIGPKYYPPHHQDILAGLNAVDFSKKPGRSEVEETLAQYIKDNGTRQFLMKSLYWKEPGQLAFRFNLKVFNDTIENIGQPLADDAVYAKPVLFLRGDKSNYIKDEDFDMIRKHFPMAEIETVSNAGHWLHAENPKEFLEKTLEFLG